MAQTLKTPVLVTPALSSNVLSTNTESLQFSIAVEGVTTHIAIELKGVSSTLVPVETLAQTRVTVELPSEYAQHTLTFTSQQIVDGLVASSSAPLQITLIHQPATLEVRALPPAGVTVKKYSNRCVVEWVTPSDDGFSGVRVKYGADAAGVASPYTQFGDVVIKDVSRVASEVVSSTTDVMPLVDGVRSTTTTETVASVNYSSATFYNDGTYPNPFYVVLSTVVFDSTTNQLYESYETSPVLCGFVDLKQASPLDFLPQQDQWSIAARQIAAISTNKPNLDLSPRSEVRDTQVDPVSAELAKASVREWFARVAMSPSALAQLDDEDGDGISDPVDSSQLKQQVAWAFNLNNSSTQKLIDKHFDLIGERVGLARGGSESAVVPVTVYTTIRPKASVKINDNAVVATQQDSSTPALSFTVRGNVEITPSNVDAYYDTQRSWWGVTLPAQCQTPGSVGNVGVNTIKKAIAGIPSGWLVTNLQASDYGLDRESNADYAAGLVLKAATGIDPVSPGGCELIARGVSSVVKVAVVESGAPLMLRDWDDVRMKHVYGTVDVYVKGRTHDVQTDKYLYAYQTLGTQGQPRSYAAFTVYNTSALQVKLNTQLSPATNLKYAPCGIIELFADRDSGSFYFDVTKSLISSSGIVTLDPEGTTYTLSSTGQKVAQVNSAGQVITNKVAFQAVVSSRNADGRPILRGLIRLNNGISYVPPLQPVDSVNSIVGSNSGSMDPTKIKVIRSQDPLLDGMSARATDEIRVDNYTTQVDRSVTFSTGGSSSITLPDVGIALDVQADGTPSNIVVRDQTKTVLYTRGVDYEIETVGQYGRFAIKRLAKSPSPVVASQGIVLDQPVLVSYPKYRFTENLTLVQEQSVTLSGTAYSTVCASGFVKDVWIAQSWGRTELANDTSLADRALNLRYIKLTYDDGSGPVVMRENSDFVTSTDESGKLRIARCVSDNTVISRIPDNAVVKVSYFTTDVFDVAYVFPSYVTRVSDAFAEKASACADVLVKAMQDTDVDIYMTVELESNATPTIVDPKIRTAIDLALNRSKSFLAQGKIVEVVQGIRGVKSVRLPFTKFSKADGAYEVGTLIPTGTSWVLANTLSLFSGLGKSTFITGKSVLPTATKPSGGDRDAYVGLLYEGEQYTRLHSADELAMAQPGSFYIIGVNDSVNGVAIPLEHVGKVLLVPKSTISNPMSYHFRVTYQVYGEAGAKDISLSKTESVKAGKIAIDYIINQELR